MTTTSSALPGDPAAVTDAWARIDAWLRLHSPVSYEMLAPPADPTEIEEAQAEMGLRFPPELLASLACHDGLDHGSAVLPVRPPLSALRILDHWQMCMEIQQDLDEEREEEPSDSATDDPPWWHPLWIPWAEVDGDSQVIDLREGPGQGVLSKTYHDDIGLVGPTWPSLAAYLTEVADVLERGGMVAELAPVLMPDGRLWWDFPSPGTESSRYTPAPTTHRD